MALSTSTRSAPIGLRIPPATRRALHAHVAARGPKDLGRFRRVADAVEPEARVGRHTLCLRHIRDAVAGRFRRPRE